MTRFPANESPGKTGLHRSISAKTSFYLLAFEISRLCRTASDGLKERCENKDDELYTSLQLSLEEQRRHVLYLSSILFARTKTMLPIPLFCSLCNNKKNVSYTFLRFTLKEQRRLVQYLSLISMEEQRRQVLHLSLLLFGRTKKTSHTPLFDSLCKRKDNKSCTSL